MMKNSNKNIFFFVLVGILLSSAVRAPSSLRFFTTDFRRLDAPATITNYRVGIGTEASGSPLRLGDDVLNGYPAHFPILRNILNILATPKPETDLPQCYRCIIHCLMGLKRSIPSSAEKRREIAEQAVTGCLVLLEELCSETSKISIKDRLSLIKLLTERALDHCPLLKPEIKIALDSINDSTRAVEKIKAHNLIREYLREALSLEKDVWIHCFMETFFINAPLIPPSDSTEPSTESHTEAASMPATDDDL